MEGLGKKTLIFIVLMLIIIGLVNVLFRLVIPTARLVSANMEPAHNKGDLLFYSSSEAYGVGDVIIYKTSQNPSVVRIIGINDDGTFEAKGDRNPTPINRQGMNETSIKNEQILGKVSFGTRWFIFYPISYGIQMLIALLLTGAVYSKLRKGI